ncbi:hypothetical protein FDECE_7086 [Fusarium decemcellulare]|nr:hypothetical protein FDECE_7086 [Fusarium decemcellulare]
MAEFAEFYVSCNPPLLPNGVSLVITDLKNALGSKAIEVLYEPEVPWFKIIANSDDQAEITKWMQTRLEELLEEETGALDDDFNQDDADIEPGAQPDVEILTDNPHVIPWPLLSRSKDVDLEAYNDFRFPQHINQFQHKTVWKGLETSDGITIHHLLSKFSFLWTTPGSELTLEKFGELINCQMSHNLTGTQIYLGSDCDIQSLEAVIQTLDTLLSLMDAPVARGSHSFFSEGSTEEHLSYLWLNHTGLSKLTYVEPTTFDAEQEYERIAGAVSLRTDTAENRSRSGPDRTVYPLGNTTLENPNTVFHPFSGYVYATKQHTVPVVYNCSMDESPVPQKQKKASKKATQPSRKPPTTPRKKQNVAKKLQNVSLQVEKLQIPKGAKLSVDAGDQGQILAGEEKKPRREPKPENNMLFSGVENVPWQGIRSPISNHVSVTNWIAGLVDGGADDAELIPQLTEEGPREGTSDMTASAVTLRDDILVDFGLEDDLSQHTRPQRQFNSPTDHPQLLDLDDFISMNQIPTPQTPTLGPKLEPGQCLLDTESPRKEFHGMFAALDPFAPNLEDHSNATEPRIIAPGENLMDYLEAPLHTPALMDQLSSMNKQSRGSKLENNSGTRNHDADVFFGKQADKPKEFFETMKQKAAPGPSWASVASKKQAEKPEEKNIFGQNVRVTVVPDRSKTSGQDKKQVDHGNMDSQKATRESEPTKQANQNRETAKKPQEDPIPAGVPSSAARVVPGMDPVPPSFSDCIEAIEPAEKAMHELTRILQVTPGKLSLEAKFGRLCIKNLVPSLVNMGNGPSWSMNMVLKSLNGDDFGEEHIGFYTILTTIGAEANLIPQLAGCQTAWMPSEKHVFYEFVCMPRKGTTPLLVKVNAETFSHECLPMAQEMTRHYIHCTKRAWDVKFVASRMSMDTIPEDFKQFAAALVGSLSIRIDDGTRPTSEGKGEIEIKTGPRGFSEWEVDSVNIRHVAMYRDGAKGKSRLTITMTRPVHRLGTVRRMPAGAFFGGTKRPTLPGKGTPTQWFEASISSTRAEELMKENMSLKFGDSTKWTPEKLKEEGVMKALCEPALRMVRQMDRVGATNQNGQGPRTGQRIYDTIADSKDREKDYQFW